VTVAPWVPAAILAAVALQRLAELVLARRNTRALLAAGGVEVGAGHYPFLVGVHVLWFVVLAAWIARGPAAFHGEWAAAYLALQPLRAWTMLSLGRFWTTRIITVPGVPPVRRGPYRFVRHPNYIVVAGEIAALPLAFGAWPLAVAFTVLNAVALTLRLRAENAALAARAS
jgi:methyltransferase